MGTFLFKWAHPASEVYVTGTFDDWKKTEKLEKVGDHFEKTVTLPDASAKIFYKFVVDGDWVIDHTAPREVDEGGNENNILTPERIVTEAPATAAIMSTVSPDSTTAALAAGAPLEKKADAEVPAAVPQAPASEPEKSGDFSVNPFPAAVGAINPIQLTPGEKIPESLTTAGATDNVKLDPESYEKSDALPGGPPVILSSAAPESTTAALAASAPIETKVPEVVKESQEKAGADPEASAVPEEVEEKAAVESELLEKVKEAPAASEGTAGQGADKAEKAVTADEAADSVSAVAAAVGTAAVAAVAGAVAAKDTVVEKATEAVASAEASAVEAAAKLPESIKENLPESVREVIASASKEETQKEVSPEVPAEVKQSIAEAGKEPEAAANTEAVEEKKAVEAELLKEVKPAEANPAEAKPAEAEAPEVETEPTAAVAGDKPAAEPAATNGTTAEPAAPAEAAASDSAAKPTEAATEAGDKAGDSSGASEKKKRKNRLSAIFGRVKSRFSHK